MMNALEPIPFVATANWPEPDLTIVQPSRPAAPVMSNDEFAQVFGPWAKWLKNAAEAKGVPVDYVALSLLTTASAVIGNSRWASPWEGWNEPTILWAMLVGDPSAGKSPALDAVLDPVKEIERDFSEEYKAKRKEWETKAELAHLALENWKREVKVANKEGGDPPTKPSGAESGSPPIRQRISISDVTIEKVAELLTAYWRGLLLSRDELSGWLGSMDRYNGGGDRPFWLEAHGGRSYTVDRKNSPEPIIVDHLSIAILGGTQPDKLASLLLKTDDDGLLARFLTVYPEPVPLTRPNTQVDKGRLKLALQRLRDLPLDKDEHGNPRPQYVTFTDDAAEVFHEFRGQCVAWGAESAGMFKSHIGKLQGLALRVSCVLAYLDWAVEGCPNYPTKIKKCHIGRACHLVGEHLRLHAYRAYGKIAAPKEIRNARRLASFIQQDRPHRLTVREIQRKSLGGLETALLIENALRVLVEADWLRKEREDSGGRPRWFYSVNPKLRMSK